MNDRKNITMLLAGISCLLAAHLYLSFGGGEKLTKRLTVIDRSMLGADTIVIDRGAAPTVELVKKDDGWKISRPYSARAGEDGVARILDGLALYKILETYSDSELSKFGKRRSDFGLGDPSVSVSVCRGAESVSVFLGRKTPAGDGVFATRAGDPMIYVLDPRVVEALDVPADHLRSRALMDRAGAPVDMFDIKRSHGVLMRFSKVNGRWMRCADGVSACDTPASGARIDELLTALAKTEAEGFVWPVGATNETSAVTAPQLAGYGLDPESGVTVTIRDRGLPPRQIVLGNEAGDGLVYALVQNAGAIVTVDGALKDMAAKADFADVRIFPFEASRVSRISVAEGGVDYLLEKKPDGKWVLDSPVAAPADGESVDTLLDRILASTVDDRDDNGVHVSLATNIPAQKISRARLLTDFSLADLRSREITRIQPAHVRRIVSTPRGERTGASVVYDRDKRAWIVESSNSGMSVRDGSVELVLEQLDPLMAESVVTLKASEAELEKFGLANPSCTVSVDFFDEKSLRRNIFIGDRTATGYYATMGAAFDAVFIISDETVSHLASPLLAE